MSYRYGIPTTAEVLTEIDKDGVGVISSNLKI